MNVEHGAARAGGIAHHELAVRANEQDLVAAGRDADQLDGEGRDLRAVARTVERAEAGVRTHARVVRAAVAVGARVCSARRIRGRRRVITAGSEESEERKEDARSRSRATG